MMISNETTTGNGLGSLGLDWTPKADGWSGPFTNNSRRFRKMGGREYRVDFSSAPWQMTWHAACDMGESDWLQGGFATEAEARAAAEQHAEKNK
jgi:hypothetical protein